MKLINVIVQIGFTFIQYNRLLLIARPAVHTIDPIHKSLNIILPIIDNCDGEEGENPQNEHYNISFRDFFHRN